MTVSVYVVEVETGLPGYRLEQHIKAETQQEAEDKVAANLKAAVISKNTYIRRDCTLAEATDFLAAKAVAEVVAEVAP
jgi:hypothetical protein